jgi:hypothetical protein
VLIPDVSGNSAVEESLSGLRSGGVARRDVTPGAAAALEQRASLIQLQPHSVRPVPTAHPSGQDVAPRGPAAPQTNVPRVSSAAPAQRGEGSPAGAGGRTSVKSAGPGSRSERAPVGTRIGVISDNHGYLNPAVLEVFAGVTHIIHAGDVMDPEILVQLGKVAPVSAVAGNMDSGEPTSALPREVVGEVAGVRFLVGHKRKRLLRELAAGKVEGLPEGAAPDLVVYGHDHIPAAAWVDGTLYLDPGSASAPHEEDDGPTVAIVEVKPAGLAVCFVPLERRDLNEPKARSKE